MRCCLTFWLSTIVLLLAGCSNFSVTIDKQKTPHYRHYATISSGDEDDSTSFDIRKRNRSIQAEKLLYKEGQFSASAIAGRHRQQRWMSGLYLSYEF